MTAPNPASNGGAGPQPPGTFRCDDPKKVQENITRFLKARFTDPNTGRVTLVNHRTAFFAWTGTHFREVATDTIRAEVYDVFSTAVYIGQVGRGQNAVPAWVDFDVDDTKVNKLMDGIKSRVLLDRDVDVPTWMSADKNIPISLEDAPCDPHEVIACRNGLLSTADGRFWQHAPWFFNHDSVTYDYDPYAADPENWLRFLMDLWPDDQETIDTLQEIFGYLLTHRTEQQKMFLFYGAKRGGKGTIIRVLQSLLGERNVTTPSMGDLNDPQFGLSSLEKATLAVMTDLRFDKRQDGTATERLLKITGEDTVLINKKFQQPYTARLYTRIIIASNLLPRLKDESGALQSRYILLRFTKSFYGQEDTGLMGRLYPEMPGVLNWALEGLKRLNERGYFVQPRTGKEDLEAMTDMSAPHMAFGREMLEFDPEFTEPLDNVWLVWKEWCRESNLHPGTKQAFSSSLRGAYPEIPTPKRRGPRGGQIAHLLGTRLGDEGRSLLAKQQWLGNLSTPPVPSANEEA